VGRVALHRLDQVGDQVAALLQLHVDIGEGLVDVLTQRDQPVVDPEQDQDDDDGDDDQDDGGHGSPPVEGDLGHEHGVSHAPREGEGRKNKTGGQGRRFPSVREIKWEALASDFPYFRGRARPADPLWSGALAGAHGRTSPIQEKQMSKLTRVMGLAAAASLALALAACGDRDKNADAAASDAAAMAPADAAAPPADAMAAPPATDAMAAPPATDMPPASDAMAAPSPSY
jgi:hypothetical protein